MGFIDNILDKLVDRFGFAHTLALVYMGGLVITIAWIVFISWLINQFFGGLFVS